MSLTFDSASLFQLAFYVVLLVFVIHASIVAYHWLSFGADRRTSLLGVAVYLGGGATFILLLAISLNFI